MSIKPNYREQHCCYNCKYSTLQGDVGFCSYPKTAEAYETDCKMGCDWRVDEEQSKVYVDSICDNWWGENHK